MLSHLACSYRPPVLEVVWYLVYQSFVIFEKQFLLQSTEKCWLFVVKNFPSRLTLYQHYIKSNIFLPFIVPIHAILGSDHLTSWFLLFIYIYVFVPKCIRPEMYSSRYVFVPKCIRRQIYSSRSVFVPMDERSERSFEFYKPVTKDRNNIHLQTRHMSGQIYTPEPRTFEFYKPPSQKTPPDLN